MKSEHGVNYIETGRGTVSMKDSEDNSLKAFLTQWDESYKNSMEKIDLFKPELTAEWTREQKIFFAKTF